MAETTILKGNTRHLDIIVMDDFIRSLQLSGVLKIRGAEQTIHFFYNRGLCFFSAPGAEIAESIFDFLPLLLEDQKLMADVLSFAHDHPRFLIDAIEAAGTQFDDLAKKIRIVSREALFRGFLLPDADIEFVEDNDVLSRFTADEKLRDMFLHIPESQDAVQERQNIHLHLSRILTTGSPLIGELTSIDEALVSGGAGDQTVGHLLLRQQHIFDPYELYQRLLERVDEGYFSFTEPDRNLVYQPFAGSEKVIHSILEVFRGMLPLLFSSQNQEFLEQDVSVFRRVTEKATQYYPLLFSTAAQVVKPADFFATFIESLLHVEPQNKIPSLRKSLNALLLFAMVEKKNSISAAEWGIVLNKLRGFLKFICQAGSVDQCETAAVVESLVFLLASDLEVDRDSGEFGEGLEDGAIREDTGKDPVTEIIESLLDKNQITEAFDALHSLYVPDDSPLRSDVLKKATAHFQQSLGGSSATVSLKPEALQEFLSDSDIRSDEVFLLSRIAERISLGELMKLSGLEEPYFYRLLYKFRKKGIVISEDSAGKRVTGQHKIHVNNANASVEFVSHDETSNGSDNGSKRHDSPRQQKFDLSPAEDAILKSLKKELQELTISLPHDIFGMHPQSTMDDFEKSHSLLRARYDQGNFPSAIYDRLSPVLGRIMSIIEESAVIIRGYLINSPAPPEADSGQHIESESVTQPESSSKEVIRDRPDSEAVQIEVQGGPVQQLEKEVRRPAMKASHALSDRKQKAMEYQTQALKAKSDGNLDEALELYHKALQLTPENLSLSRAVEDFIIECNDVRAQEMVFQARQEIEKGKHQKAAKLVKEAIERDGTKPAYYVLLAQISASIPGKLKDAEYCCRKALEMEPGNSDYYLLLGRIAKSQGNLIEARIAFQDALRWNKKNSDARKELNILP